MNATRQTARQLVGAGIAAFDPLGRLLMIRRRDNGLWDLPGGRVEPGERVEDAATREFLEETGLRPGPLGWPEIFSGPEFRHRYPDGNEVDWVTILFTARGLTGLPVAGDDAAEAAWIDPARLPLEMGPATRQYLARLGGREAR